ncbi:hypothetical protein KL867_01330 [Ruegeria litorea]|uniref:Uncharacterized protein n=1 Tax=Falsiruegeria litorea TaxID=1280831 RepID=A0ABS5WKN7_9RHOB|nr:hypothetical protein [Falsiruegeria litorea]MBT3139685.1 hypothetical protein [Falsiruegeria litorea]
MTHLPELEFASSAERLKTLTNLVELALYAPEGEVTLDGRAALQRAAREIVILADEVTGVVGVAPN